MATDDAVEAGERDVRITVGNAEMCEAGRAEVLDRLRGKIDPPHATISAAGPSKRAKRGTVSSRSTCAQNSISASSPGGPYVRAFNPASGSGHAAAITSAPIAASLR